MLAYGENRFAHMDTAHYSDAVSRLSSAGGITGAAHDIRDGQTVPRARCPMASAR
jgi:hypothetical protein